MRAQLGLVGVLRHQGDRPEALLQQAAAALERPRWHRQDGGGRGPAPTHDLAAGHHLGARRHDWSTPANADRPMASVSTALRSRGCQRLADGRGGTGACGSEEEAGLGAELTRAQRERPDEATGHLRQTRRTGGRHHHRVDRPHLGEDGDDRVTLVGQAPERETALLEPVKATAAVCSEVTMEVPACKPATSPRTQSGAPASRSATAASRPSSTDRCGCAGCALATTGQPAASADAVSLPRTPKANGKLLAPNTATGPKGAAPGPATVLSQWGGRRSP